MSIHNYVTTIHPPTAVRFAVKGNFIAPDETNLIVSKESRIEIYKVNEDSLTPFMDFQLFAHISDLRICQQPSRSTASLFVLSEQLQFCVLSYDSRHRSITTDASGKLEQKNARPADRKLTVVDPLQRAVIASVYTGLLFVIPIVGSKGASSKGKNRAMDSSFTGSAFSYFNIRISELKILSMAALHGTSKPTVVLLSEDYNNERRVIKSFALNLQVRDTQSVHQQIYCNDGDMIHTLIAVPKPRCGILAVGEFGIIYYDLKGHQVKAPVQWGPTISYETVDNEGFCFMVCDGIGKIHLVHLEGSTDTVTNIRIESFGRRTESSVLVHLSPSLYYLGSHQGDSQLFQVKQDASNTHVLTVVAEFPSLAPIVHFCLYDLDNQGRQSMVCCSGGEYDGSLRIAQSGIGFVETAALQIPGIKRLWSIPTRFKSVTHDTLIVSTTMETRVFHCHKNQRIMDEYNQFSSFAMEEPTIATSLTASHKQIIQVTPSSVRLVSKDPHGNQLALWKPQDGSFITVADVNPYQGIISHGNGTLVYFEWADGNLKVKSSTTLDQEIAALDISIDERISAEPAQSVAVGLWSGTSLQLLHLPSLSVTDTVTLPQHLVPRSILRTVMEGIHYVFVALGDGHMIYYQLNDEQKLCHPKQLTLGTHLLTLHAFYTNDTKFILATSDRPTLISSVRKRLIYSAVNLKNVCAFAAIHTPSFPQTLIMVSENTLLFGYADPAHKLHFSKVPLHQEMAQRIAFHEASQTLAVGIVRTVVEADTGIKPKSGSLRIFDARTFKNLSEIPLKECEVVESLSSAKVLGQDPLFMFVGTSIEFEDDKNRNEGRLIMFEVSPDGVYTMIDAVQVPGVVYGIKPYQDTIAVAVDGSIYLLESFQPSALPGERLKLGTKIYSGFITLCLDVRGDKILTDDYYLSMSLISEDDEGSLRKVATSHAPRFSTAARMVNDEVFLEANSESLFTFKHIPSSDDEKTDDLMQVGEYHLGDQINHFCQGTLSCELEDPDEATALSELSTVYTTVAGAIGVVSPLTEERYDILARVQDNMTRVISPVGRFDYREWRTLKDGIQVKESRNFIDGDLIESFLRLDREQQEQIVVGANGGAPLGCNVQDLRLVIESLSRIH